MSQKKKKFKKTPVYGLNQPPQAISKRLNTDFSAAETEE